MRRLIPEALYYNEMVEEHYLRDRRKVGEPCDVTNPNATWDGLAERIGQIDPDGQRSYALLKEVEAKENQRVSV